MCEQVDKLDYLSQAVAENAVVLHKLSAPDCTTIAAYPCHDHWHLGHSGLNADERAKAAACKSEHPFYAPFRRRMHRKKAHA